MVLFYVTDFHYGELLFGIYVCFIKVFMLYKIAKEINTLMKSKEFLPESKMQHIRNPDGTHEWRLNGELHREDGPAVYSTGKEEKGHWYLNGERHREDGPAVPDGLYGTEWYLNGERHREDGPAVQGRFGNEWWIHGEQQPDQKNKPEPKSNSDLEYEKLKNNVTNFFRKVNRDCQPYLLENDEALISGYALHRGMDDSKPMREVPVWKNNRHPSSTSKEIHKISNKYFLKKFGKPFRNAMFATSDRKRAEFYGATHLVFPKGTFEYIWSPTWEDSWDEMVHVWNKWENHSTQENIQNTVKALESANYQSDNLKAGILSMNEVMIWCDSYYAINLKVYNQFQNAVPYDKILYGKK